MSIDLKKGQGVNLSKQAPGLNKIRVGLGWGESNPVMDLDVCMFGLRLVNGAPKLHSEDYFIFYNHKESSDGAVKHLGDNRTGAGTGDDETILIELAKVNADVLDLSLFVTIYDEKNMGYNFGKVAEAYIRILDDATGVEIAKYKLNEQFTNESALQFGSLVRNGSDWEFKAVGAGYVADLGAILGQYQ